MNAKTQQSLKNLSQDLQTLSKNFLPWLKGIKTTPAALAQVTEALEGAIQALGEGKVSGLTQFDNLRASLTGLKNTVRRRRFEEDLRILKEKHFTFKRVQFRSLNPGQVASLAWYNDIAVVKDVIRKDNAVIVESHGAPTIYAWPDDYAVVFESTLV